MFDLIIRGDQVVTPQGSGAWDVCISGETIAAIAAPGTFDDGQAGRVIDATGKIVIPGGIDPHIHSLWPMPSLEGGDPIMTDGPDVVSRAAIHGGTTTLLDFATWHEGQTIDEAVNIRKQDWSGKCFADYGYHIMLQGAIPPELLPQIAEAIQEGYPSVKIFTTDITPSRRGRKITHGHIWEIFKVLKREGGIGAIHAEDDEIVMHMYDVLSREGRTGFENLAEVHNSMSEDLSFRRIIRLAEHVEGTPLYMMHVSAATGVAAIEAARARGYPIYGETLHQYLMFTHEHYKRPNGQIYHTYPSLKESSDQEALWEGQLRGSISTVATDEICCTLSTKTQGHRIDDCTGGNAGCEPRVAVMYTEMVKKRGYSLAKFTDLVSTNAAKLMGMYPKKGVLAAGSDADITVLDPAEGRTVTAARLHETDYTPWEGYEAEVWPSLVVLRGKVMMQDGEFLGDVKDGQHLKRKVAEAIRQRPVL
ncbi:MAG: amidohydrolase family protein [Alphaproteobacteria bacterium]|jgi:dihydropyrimidinase|nr:amidohydrolase family protein [Alphaproteobacteria bacterium]MDP6567942.1 amidohydrolase family protein [Alphaproteobacteria bacterium]MDP6812352.1 amidohydrolase family protein [Alphaproteobacteria bacterium]